MWGSKGRRERVSVVASVGAVEAWGAAEGIGGAGGGELEEESLAGCEAEAAE